MLHLSCLPLGTSWSVLQGIGQSRQRTILSSNFEDGIWIWEAEGDKRGHSGVNIPRDTRVPSSAVEGLHQWNRENYLCLSEVIFFFTQSLHFWRCKLLIPGIIFYLVLLISSRNNLLIWKKTLAKAHQQFLSKESMPPFLGSTIKFNLDRISVSDFGCGSPLFTC